MNSDFHYWDGLKLRILFSVIIFLGVACANCLITEKNQKNALVQAIAYTGRSDFISSEKTEIFDETRIFLKKIRSSLY